MARLRHLPHGPGRRPRRRHHPRTAAVHGIANLHVVDGSLMPTAPRANLNLPIIMLAEKLAAAIGTAERGA